MNKEQIYFRYIFIILVCGIHNKQLVGDIKAHLENYDEKVSKKCLKEMWKAALGKEAFLTRVLVKHWATRGMLKYASKAGS